MPENLHTSGKTQASGCNRTYLLPDYSPHAASVLDWRPQVIKVENLSYTYTGSDRVNLKNMDLEIERGEFILLTGP